MSEKSGICNIKVKRLVNMTNLLISKSLINDVLIPQELIEMVIDIFDQRTSDIIESGDDPNISPVEFSAKLSIYNGYCGYLLFFIDCSHADCWDPFLAERIDKCIETGMGIVTQLKLRLRSGIGSLLTGYSGISYCCLRYWQKNRNDQYLNHALSIISESASDQTVCASEHMVGLSGLLSLVCYCYKETEIDCLTEIAESIADRIVNAKIPYSNGYVWDF